jgi:hypothetical protein
MQIIGRDEARKRGLKRYFTGEPCLHGHIAERWVSTKDCVECNRLSKQAQRRANPYGACLENWFESRIVAWRHANPDLARRLVRLMIRARERRAAMF